MTNSQSVAINCTAATIFIFSKCQREDRVLLLRRTDTLAGRWCQVAGGIEAGEKAWETVLRETIEETSLCLDHLYSADCCEQIYDFSQNKIELLPVFVGFVSDDAKVVLNPEHDAFRWVNLAQARELLPFPQQRTTLEMIWQHFISQAPSELLRINIPLKYAAND